MADISKYIYLENRISGSIIMSFVAVLTKRPKANANGLDDMNDLNSHYNADTQAPGRIELNDSIPPDVSLPNDQNDNMPSDSHSALDPLDLTDSNLEYNDVNYTHPSNDQALHKSIPDLNLKEMKHYTSSKKRNDHVPDAAAATGSGGGSGGGSNNNIPKRLNQFEMQLNAQGLLSREEIQEKVNDEKLRLNAIESGWTPPTLNYLEVQRPLGKTNPDSTLPPRLKTSRSRSSNPNSSRSNISEEMDKIISERNPITSTRSNISSQRDRSYDNQDSFRSYDNQDSYRSYDNQDSYRSYDYQDSFRSYDSKDSYRSYDNQDSYRSYDSKDSFRSYDSKESFESRDSYTSYSSVSYETDNLEPVQDPSSSLETGRSSSSDFTEATYSYSEYYSARTNTISSVSSRDSYSSYSSFTYETDNLPSSSRSNKSVFTDASYSYSEYFSVESIPDRSIDSKNIRGSISILKKFSFQFVNKLISNIIASVTLSQLESRKVSDGILKQQPVVYARRQGIKLEALRAGESNNLIPEQPEEVEVEKPWYIAKPTEARVTIISIGAFDAVCIKDEYFPSRPYVKIHVDNVNKWELDIYRLDKKKSSMSQSQSLQSEEYKKLYWGNLDEKYAGIKWPSLRRYQDLKFDFFDGGSGLLFGYVKVNYSEFILNDKERLGGVFDVTCNLRIDKSYGGGNVSGSIKLSVSYHPIEFKRPIQSSGYWEAAEKRSQHWTLYPLTPISTGQVRSKFKLVSKLYDQQMIVNPVFYGFISRCRGPAPTESRFINPIFTGYNLPKKGLTPSQLEKVQLDIQKRKDATKNPYKWVLI